MLALLFSLAISIGIPVFLLLYAVYTKRWSPFLLGVLAFVVSQVLLRIPLLQYLGSHSISYVMFQATQPILFSILLGLSAGVFEEVARYVAMRFFMVQRDWKSGFLFGAGHGGIEAVLFVGVPLVSALFSPMLNLDITYALGGVERFFAMMLHIGLTMIVLQGVVQKRLLFLVLAILIHGGVDALVGILPLYVPKDYVLFVLESVLALTALALLFYSLMIKKKGVLR